MGIIVVYWTGTFKHFEHFWALFFTLGIFFFFGHFSTPCIRNNALGQLGSSERRCSTVIISSILNVQIENGSSDDLINQQSYTTATKMSPWPSKMATLAPGPPVPCQASISLLDLQLIAGPQATGPPDPGPCV